MSLYSNLLTVLTPYANKIKQNELTLKGVASGTPNIVSSMSDMTDTDEIYILSTDGKWYYYNLTSSSWVVGGTYGGVPTDTTLSQSGVSADAKATGDVINEVIPSDIKNSLYTLLANATYTRADMSRQVEIIKEWANVEIDTTARIVSEGKILFHNSSGYTQKEMQYGGVTQRYYMRQPTTTLYPAGIIPTTGSVIANNGASIVVYDANGEPITYVNENTGATGSYNRWAQDASNEMVEYSKSWTVGEYSSIAFSVDIRYLDDAYMYDKPSGKVWFAGKNTPYYGMSNISQASI